MQFFRRVWYGIKITWYSVKMMFTRRGYWLYPLIGSILFAMFLTATLSALYAIYGNEIFVQAKLFVKWIDPEQPGGPSVKATVVGFLLIFILLFFNTLVSTFISIAISFYTLRALSKDFVSVKMSLRYSYSRLKDITLWAIIVATFGVLLSRTLSIPRTFLASLSATMAGLGFGLASYFISPAFASGAQNVKEALHLSVVSMNSALVESITGELLLKSMDRPVHYLFVPIYFVVGVIICLTMFSWPTYHPALLLAFLVAWALFYVTFVSMVLGTINTIFRVLVFSYVNDLPIGNFPSRLIEITLGIKKEE